MMSPDEERANEARLARSLSLRALVPNAITAAALCSGLTGIRFAIAGDFEKAVYAVILAGVLDGIDGRAARMLKAQSRFGAELDSLADSISFGVAPALIVYLWALRDQPSLGGSPLSPSRSAAFCDWPASMRGWTISISRTSRPVS
jgi:CDP-diacylglycerol--serine O-phosphatidyltransferase